MLTLLVKLFISALSIFLVGNFLSGIHVPNYMTALWVAFVLGVINVTLRPILKLLALPITVITLGLFAFVVNGFTFWLVAKMLDGFSVDTFWWAILGALIVSVVTAILNRIVLGSDGKLGGD